ncbi:putative Acid phosphatase [Dioscorea sansibarensis]
MMPSLVLYIQALFSTTVVVLTLLVNSPSRHHLPIKLPLKFAIVGDVGQSGWANSTLQHLGVSDNDVLLLPGDLSYADLDQPLWDSVGIRKLFHTG